MIVCPNRECASEMPDDARFCGECGSPMAAAAVTSGPRCGSCGEDEFDADGYCCGCGAMRGSRPSSGSASLGVGIAAVTDVGLSITHTRNDDAFVVLGPPTGGPGSILVVCDGISRSQNPDKAAAAASQVAAEAISQLTASGTSPEDAVAAAIVRAHEAACATPFDPADDTAPPGATIVVAYLHGDEYQTRVTVGWLGDSRAYRLSRTGGELLTRDHSWLNEVVDAGEMPYERARLDKRAHNITKAIGKIDRDDVAPCGSPGLKTLDLVGDGWILLCTDGLWNYADDADEVIRTAKGTLWTTEAIDVCLTMVACAKESGGQDNITVALARFGAR